MCATSNRKITGLLLHRFDGVARIAQQLQQALLARQVSGANAHEAGTLGHDHLEFLGPAAVAAIDKDFHFLLAVAAHCGIGHHSEQLVQILSQVGIGKRCRLHLEELWCQNWGNI